MSEGARVGGCMGPWEEGRECVGACVASCDLAHVYAACMCVRVSIDIYIYMYIYIYMRAHIH